MKQKSGRAGLVFGYARVSTGKQEHSIPAQVSKIRAQALLKDLSIHAIIEDADESAKTLDRPGLQKLLESIERGEVCTIIITKLDRLTRRIADIDRLIQLFDRKRVTLISTAENLDTASATGRMMVNMIVLMSQWEREVIGERTRDAMAGMKSRGLQTGNVPYGFQRGAIVGETRTGRPVYSVVPFEHEQNVLLVIRTMRAASQWGHSRAKSNSFRAIAAELNRQGFKTRKGGEWKPEYVWGVVKGEGTK